MARLFPLWLCSRLCWTIAAHEGQTVIFQKPVDSKCYAEREPQDQPQVCDADTNLDNAWYIPMASCIAPASGMETTALPMHSLYPHASVGTGHPISTVPCAPVCTCPVSCTSGWSGTPLEGAAT